MAFPVARNQVYAQPAYTVAHASAVAPRSFGTAPSPVVSVRSMPAAAQPTYMTQPSLQPVRVSAGAQRTVRPSIVSMPAAALPPVQETAVAAPMPAPQYTAPATYMQPVQQTATAMYGAAMQVEDDFDRQVTDYAHGIRTAKDNEVTSKRALEKLQEGNQRFVAGTPAQKAFRVNERSALATYGQRPMATIIGCADSRCGTDTIFDAQPGDLFVLRNAGNTLTHAEGSMVGSAEYSVCNLGTHLIVVLGHTHCGAIAGATKCMLDRKAGKMDNSGPMTTLQSLLADLEPVAAQAQLELQVDAKSEDIASHAVYVNVFNSIEKLLAYSEPLREKCRDGLLEVHGAVYDIVSGNVDFLGQHPRLPLLLGSQSGLLHRPTPIQ